MITLKGKHKGAYQKIIITMGICLVAGSFSACGDDTDVMSEVFHTQEASQSVIKAEDLAESSVEDNIENGIENGIENSTENSLENSGKDGNENAMTQVSDVSITISAAGDVTLGTHKEQDYGNSFTQAFDVAQTEGEGYTYFFENVYDIFKEDDMTIVNLEGPLTDSEDMREGQIYSIKGSPSYVNILTAGSVEAVSMGNNHRLDYKEQGCEDTVQVLTEADIPYSYEGVIGTYETQGIRIGFLSVNEVALGYTVESFLEEGIKQLREEGVDLVLACCHWGVEREYFPEDYQKALGRKCIDWGADLVIGHHPHVLQGIEEYQGKYIIYSLGNFCFGANRNPADKDTMIFQQTFTFVEGEKQEETEIKIIPCSISSVTGRNDFKPTPAEGADAERILNRINEYSAEFGVQFDMEGYRVQ